MYGILHVCVCQLLMLCFHSLFHSIFIKHQFHLKNTTCTYVHVQVHVSLSLTLSLPPSPSLPLSLSNFSLSPFSLQPSSVVVQKAGEFLISRINELAFCSSYPEAASLSGLPLTSTKRRDKISETSTRFTSREAGYPALTVTDVLFSVNKPVLLNGVCVFGGPGEEVYNYEASVLNKVRLRVLAIITVCVVFYISYCI